MWIGDIIDRGLEGLFKAVLPDELAEKVADPIGDVAGAAIGAATGRWDKAAGHSLDLAEDFAQWAGENRLAGRLDTAAKTAGSLLGPPLSLKSGTWEEVVGKRAIGASMGALGGGVSGGKDGALRLANLGASGITDSSGKLMGAAAGGTAGAAVHGKEGFHAGGRQGASLGHRLEMLKDLESMKLGLGVTGSAMRVGGLAAGLYLTSKWSVWPPGAGPRPNTAAFHWGAEAGGLFDSVAATATREGGKAQWTQASHRVEGEAEPRAQALAESRLDEIRRKNGAKTTGRDVAAWAGQAARAARVVAEGKRLRDERFRDAASSSEAITARVLGYATQGFDWLASSPDAERIIDVLRDEMQRKLGLSKRDCKEVFKVWA